MYVLGLSGKRFPGAGTDYRIGYGREKAGAESGIYPDSSPASRVEWAELRLG